MGLDAMITAGRQWRRSRSKQMPRDPLGKIAIRTLVGRPDSSGAPVDAHAR